MANVDFTPGLIAYAIRQAHKGDELAARDVARYAAHFLAEESPLPRDLREWLLEALKKIALGEQAIRPLFTDRKQGRTEIPNEKRDQAITREVERLHIFQGLPLESDARKDAAAASVTTTGTIGAYATVAKRRHLSESTVKKAHLRWRDGIRARVELDLLASEDQ